MPLPPIKPHCGLRLPPDRYCLTATNYRLRSNSQTKKLTKSALDSRSTLKTQFKTQSNIMSASKRGPPPLTVTKTQLTTIPKPVFKFSTQQKQIAVNPNSKIIIPNHVPPADIKMEVDPDDGINNPRIGGVELGSLKREREDDDFEIVT